MKVIEPALAQIAYGWSPEELHFQYPHLSLGQIYSALACYWDHREELEQDIERRLRLVEQQQQKIGLTPFAKRINDKDKRLFSWRWRFTWISMSSKIADLASWRRAKNGPTTHWR